MSSNPHRQFAVRVAIALGLTLLAVAIGWITFVTLHVLLLLFAAVVLAVFLASNAHWISHWTRMSYGASLAAQLIVLTALLIAAGALLANPISQQVAALSEKLPESLSRVEEWARQWEVGNRVLDRVMNPSEMVANGADVVQPARSVLTGLTTVIAGLAIFLFIAIYLAASPELYRIGILKLVPIAHRPRAAEVLGRVGYVLLWWTYGKLLEMVLVGGLTFIGLWLLGVPLAMTLALLAALMAFVPNFGPVIALIPAVLLALLQGPATAGWVVALYIGVQTLESYFVTPLVQQRTVELPPVLTIMAQVMLALLAGFLGLATATPLVAVVLAVVQMLYVNDVLGDRTVEPSEPEKTVGLDQA